MYYHSLITSLANDMILVCYLYSCRRSTEVTVKLKQEDDEASLLARRRHGQLLLFGRKGPIGICGYPRYPARP
jgi:hypothetical protein